MTPLRAMAVVLALLLSAGCAGEGPKRTSGDHSDHSSGTTTDGAGSHAAPDLGLVEPAESADWNAADATYLTLMVSHHSQAIDLTELAATRASDPGVAVLARSIDAGQGREIIVMADWLVDHGYPEPTVDSVAEMTEMGMPGMLTTAQVAALAELEASSFDRTFLEAMIQHHQGALLMAEHIVLNGENLAVIEWATDVIAGQQAEINRMRDLLLELP